MFYKWFVLTFLNHSGFGFVREILIPEAAIAAKNGPTAAHEVISAFKFILLGTFWIWLTFWASPGKRAKARFWLIHFSPYAVCVSAPLTSWAIGAGGIFKTPPSGGLLLTLSLASVMVGWQSNLQSCEDAIEKPWFSTTLFPSSLQSATELQWYYGYCHIALSSAHMLFILRKKLKFLLQRR